MTATPTAPRPPRSIADVDVPLEQLAADVARLAERRRYADCQLTAQQHVLDANDRAYIHNATDHPDLIPSSDWQPGGAA